MSPAEPTLAFPARADDPNQTAPIDSLLADGVSASAPAAFKLAPPPKLSASPLLPPLLDFDAPTIKQLILEDLVSDSDEDGCDMDDEGMEEDATHGKGAKP